MGYRLAVLTVLLGMIIGGIWFYTSQNSTLPDGSAVLFPETVEDVTAGLGVNIHFTGAPARDLDAVQVAGFRFIRMDFTWEVIETKKGVYDFTPYDQLTEALAKRGIRALYILDYSNKLYEAEQSVRTEEGRKAFAAFAAAAAKHYQGQGIIWEIWNEPNIGFWNPQPSMVDYMALVKAAVPAIRQADPKAICVAPGIAGVSLDFLKVCFDQGLLNLVDALTIHPYRRKAPESLIKDIQILRTIIAIYRPDKPDFPILSGEWGYSDAFEGYTQERQGQYLPRMFLLNVSLGIPVSIWYDLKDDGLDPKDPEHHFGALTYDYSPKPAYLEMQRLVQALKGMHFVRRLPAAPDDYLFLFSNGKKQVIAVWTAGEAHETTNPLNGKKVTLTGDPQYLNVE